MPKLNFNNQITRRQPIRSAPAKFLSSKLRGHVERSEGQRLSDAFLPYKPLPVMFIDVELSDGVVIPKGNIVSLLTNQTSTTITPSGIPNISSSGTIPSFEDATVKSSLITSVNIDDSFFGYHDSYAALLVPANGGVVSRIPYSADDATSATFTNSGVIVTAAMGADPESNYCEIDGNMPVGIVYSDVYQDIRGKHLNYNLWESWGVLCDFYIEVPYVDFHAVSNFVSGYVTGQEMHPYNLNSSTCAGYLAVWKKHAFFYFDGTDTYRDGEAGMTIKPDMNGKYIPTSTGTSITAATTAQTIGKLMLTDSRFPKDMLELVDTYPGSEMPGTETGGLPATLFNFVKDTYFGINGSYATIAQIVNLVQVGSYGLARIQLNI